MPDHFASHERERVATLRGMLGLFVLLGLAVRRGVCAGFGTERPLRWG